MRILLAGGGTAGHTSPLLATADALRRLGGRVDATVVGDGQEGAEVARLLDGVPHVRRLPWVEPDRLPALVAEHDVCLGVFGTGDKTRRVVPNKAYQGAAAGCLVVTGDTAPQRRAFGDDAVYVPLGDPAALAEALAALADDRARLDEMRTRSRARADESHRPDVVVADLDRRLRGRS